jgi:hypothetical protein
MPARYAMGYLCRVLCRFTTRMLLLHAKMPNAKAERRAVKRVRSSAWCTPNMGANSWG